MIPYFSALRGDNDSVAAVRTITQISCWILAIEDIRGVGIALGLSNKPYFLFRSAAKELIQKTSVVPAFRYTGAEEVT